MITIKKIALAVILITIAIVSLLVGCAQMATVPTTFGNADVEGNSQYLFPGMKYVSAFTAPYTGEVENLTIYGKDAFGGWTRIKAIFFVGDSVETSILSGASSETQIPAVNGWHTISFQSPIPVTAGTKYYFGVHMGGYSWFSVAYGAVGGEAYSVSDAYANGVASPFGTPERTTNELWSMYVSMTYDNGQPTPSPTPTPAPTPTPTASPSPTRLPQPLLVLHQPLTLALRLRLSFQREISNAILQRL